MNRVAQALMENIRRSLLVACLTAMLHDVVFQFGQGGVDDGQQITQKILALDADAFLALLADTLAGVFRIGEKAQVLVF